MVCDKIEILLFSFFLQLLPLFVLIGRSLFSFNNYAFSFVHLFVTGCPGFLPSLFVFCLLNHLKNAHSSFVYSDSKGCVLCIHYLSFILYFSFDLRLFLFFSYSNLWGQFICHVSSFILLSLFISIQYAYTLV